MFPLALQQDRKDGTASISGDPVYEELLQERKRFFHLQPLLPPLCGSPKIPRQWRVADWYWSFPIPYLLVKIFPFCYCENYSDFNFFCREIDQEIELSDYHVCFYTHRFEDSYNKLEASGSIFRDHKHVDQTKNWEEVEKACQFRGRDIKDQRGVVVHQFELEIRAKRHPLFCRPLALASQK